MRQIILDTETTGLEPEKGHRIIEIGGIEMIDRFFTGNNFHHYINPEREVESGAFAVHGISNDFLKDKPLFAEVMQDLISYVKDAELVIHNAPFDVGFLNHEFKFADPNAEKIEAYTSIFDTLSFARKKHPGKRNSLDALCKRYHIDNAKRELHGALLDAQLLAEVYLAMTGGQMSLFEDMVSNPVKKNVVVKKLFADRKPLPVIYATDEEQKQHQLHLEIIKQAANKCVWSDISSA